jgi:hypothetical protein
MSTKTRVAGASIFVLMLVSGVGLAARANRVRDARNAPRNDQKTLVRQHAIQQHAMHVLAEAPVRFEAGPGGSEYIGRASGYETVVNSDGARFEFKPRITGKRAGTSGKLGESVQLRLLGANARATGKASERLESYSNYFIGSDARNWRTRVPQFGEVRYRSVYPGG